MFGSQFDGAAAFSGGGFMPSQSTAQFAADPSSVSPAKVSSARALFALFLLCRASSLPLELVDGSSGSSGRVLGLARDCRTIRQFGAICAVVLAESLPYEPRCGWDGELGFRRTEKSDAVVQFYCQPQTLELRNCPCGAAQRGS